MQNLFYIYIYFLKIKPYLNYLFTIILIGLFVFLNWYFPVIDLQIPQQGIDYSYVTLTDDELQKIIEKFFEESPKN